jgi:hypothetical protein
MRAPDKPFNIPKIPVFPHTADAFNTLVEPKKQDTRQTKRMELYRITHSQHNGTNPKLSIYFSKSHLLRKHSLPGSGPPQNLLEKHK